MNDYIKQLEEQNEELKQSLANEQLKVSELTYLYSLYNPVWEMSTIPTIHNCIDEREGHRYTYGGRFCTYADIMWDSGLQSWKITWSNGLNLTPVGSGACMDVNEAKKHVEDHYRSAMRITIGRQ